MKIVRRLKVMAGAGLLTAYAVAGGGYKKEATGGKSAVRVQSIKEAGYPVTLAGLHAWYAEPPPGENGAAAYLEAFNALAPTSADAPTFLEDNAKALQLLRQAATGKKCRYPVDLAVGYEALLPHLVKVKTCSEFLKQAAIAQADGGRMDLAAQSIVDGWLVAQSLEDEPTLISQRVRMAAEINMQNALAEVLSRKAFSEAELVLLKGTFRDPDGVKGITRSLAGERAMALGIFELPPEKLAKIMAVAGAKDFAAEAYRKSPAYEADMSFYLDRAGELVAASAIPFPDCLEEVGRCSEQIKEAKGKGFQISALMLPALAAGMRRAGEVAAQRRATQAGLAVERHRATHANALPDTLKQLVPQFLAAVPADPFDGKPLRFKKEVGFVIYSVGKDMGDDGGTPRQGKEDSGYDITFVVRR